MPELVLADLDPEASDARSPMRRSRICWPPASDSIWGWTSCPAHSRTRPAVPSPPDPELAAAIVWFDALVTNVDRSPRNPNLLVWHGELWMIDHGAALYVHHSWADPDGHARKPFAAIRDHVLLRTPGRFSRPTSGWRHSSPSSCCVRWSSWCLADWLGDGTPEMYVRYLSRRLEAPRAFVEEAEEGRTDGG